MGQAARTEPDNFSTLCPSKGHRQHLHMVHQPENVARNSKQAFPRASCTLASHKGFILTVGTGLAWGPLCFPIASKLGQQKTIGPQSSLVESQPEPRADKKPSNSTSVDKGSTWKHQEANLKGLTLRHTHKIPRKQVPKKKKAGLWLFALHHDGFNEI